jgi:hypothetical protein
MFGFYDSCWCTGLERPIEMCPESVPSDYPDSEYIFGMWALASLINGLAMALSTMILAYLVSKPHFKDRGIRQYTTFFDDYLL